MLAALLVICVLLIWKLFGHSSIFVKGIIFMELQFSVCMPPFELFEMNPEWLITYILDRQYYNVVFCSQIVFLWQIFKHIFLKVTKKAVVLSSYNKLYHLFLGKYQYVFQEKLTLSVEQHKFNV